VINHPFLLSEVAEALGQMEFPDAELDKLRMAIINVFALDPDLDSAGLKRHLSETGLTEIFEDVQSLLSLEVWRFARPEAPPETVRRGWEDTKIRYLEPSAGAEIVSEEQILGAETTEEHWARLRKRVMDRARHKDNPETFDAGPADS